ncbi:disease resistance protein At4g27190-like [Fagus crenata]
MEIATAAVGAVLGPISNLLCGCVSSKMTTTLNLLSNRDIIVKNMDELVDRREEVKDETEAAVKEGKDILAQVVTWLEDVEKLELKVNPIQEEMVNNKKPSACFLNCSKRYKASREVEEILEEIKRLLDAGSFPNGVADPSPRAVLHFPGMWFI